MYHLYKSFLIIFAKKMISFRKKSRAVIAFRINLDVYSLKNEETSGLVNFNASKTKCYLISRRIEEFPDIFFESKSMELCDKIGINVECHSMLRPFLE